MYLSYFLQREQLELELPDEGDSEATEIIVNPAGDGSRRLRHTRVDFEEAIEANTGPNVNNAGRQLQSTTQVVGLLYTIFFLP